MSYILDALRRADSERERGAVPSIHAPPVPPVVDEPTPSRRQPQVLVAVIVLLLLALAGLLAWHLMSGKEAAPQPVVATAPVADVSPATPAPSAQVVQQSALPTQAPVAAQPARQTQPAQPVHQAQPAPSPSLAAAPPVVSVPARPTTSPPSSTAAVAPPPAQTPQADPRVYAVSELPANLQRELPKLVVGGAMYSETPANRMLIINSQVFHEGDKLTPDLLLQEIKLKSAVFQYKGFRYGVSY